MLIDVPVAPESIEYVDFCWRFQTVVKNGKFYCPDCPLNDNCIYNKNSHRRYMWRHKYD